jgi:hypothetical protein
MGILSVCLQQRRRQKEKKTLGNEKTKVKFKDKAIPRKRIQRRSMPIHGKLSI